MSEMRILNKNKKLKIKGDMLKIDLAQCGGNVCVFRAKCQGATLSVLLYFFFFFTRKYNKTK